jgi:aminoglycoside phosphotransferase (APT) family kinase protein
MGDPHPPEIAALGTPEAEHLIDAALVAGLLADQHPDLARLPLRAVDAGWDNAMFRLGERWAVRLPRRLAAAPLIIHEQEWLPRLAPQLTLPVPTPVRAGLPGRSYPWRWSVVPWLPGAAADQREPEPDQARPFAAFLRSLHTPAPAAAPANPVRGVPLARRADAVAARMRGLAGRTDLLTPQIRRVWEDALAAPLDVPPTWLHGDLHPRNLLLEAGALSAVIDWGDICAGDRATDLAAIWMLFADPQARAVALDAYGDLSAATLRRARGWAVLFGVMLLATGLVDHPGHARIGERTLRRVAEDVGP